jgi:hypothetical protein
MLAYPARRTTGQRYTLCFWQLNQQKSTLLLSGTLRLVSSAICPAVFIADLTSNIEYRLFGFELKQVSSSG